MKNLILVLSLLFSSILFSQTKVKGIVVDESGESVAFCNVIFKNSIKGTTTDENGKFYLESKKTYKELAVSFMGYKTTTISLKRVNYGLKIVLKEEGSNLKQVVIYSGKIKRKGNPAIALLKKMWDKKRKNGIHMFDYYEHDKYEKVEFDINNIDDDFKNQKLFKGMEFVFEKIDTSDVTGKTYLPFFINESKYKTFGKNTFPTQLRDELIANRNSGTKNNQNVNEFLKQLYADYNVYDNFIRLFDKAFTSPLSKVGPYTYNYVLTDSAFIGNKWCYNVTFYPRRKNELTFKGDFWVNDTTFAVKKIQMHASKSANINWIKEIYLEQEFTVLNDSVFLLKRDHMMSDFSLSKKDSKKGIYGRRTTMYDNYQFNIKKDNSFYTKRSKADYDIAVYTKDDNYWKKNRLEKLSDKEMGIYQLIDTLKTNKKFNRLYSLTEILASGYWNFMHLLDFGPILSTIGKNDVEGVRLRFGGRSYIKESDRLRLEGYVAYGLKDEKFKHGISAKFLADRKSRLIISGGNRRDIEQTGVSLTTSNNVSDRSFASSALFSRGKNARLTKLNVSNLGIAINPIKNLELQVGATYKEIESAAPDEFNINFFDDDGNVKSSFKQTEFDFVVRYTPGRKIGGFGVKQQIHNKLRYPVFYLSYTKGVKGMFGSEFDFDKLQFYYRQRFQVGGLGKLKYTVEFGKTFGSVPLSLLDVVPGNQSPLRVTRTFDLLDYYEFVTDKYASLHLEH
ncbi:MAG TPA: carboxypeptidase-like regulatory domain-containing protein, partial [Flavobacteriaceae bacterium]|nr:carboxypeptidase-like regulatory domain-containing protein [Flavobacteriaceae bacterium]